MLVTLDIFSGRPNPAWTLSEEEQRQLLARVQGRQLVRAEMQPPQLGYRGLIIQPTEEHSAELPQAFRIGGAVQLSDAASLTKGKPLNASEEDEAVQYVLGTARDNLSDDLQQVVSSERERRIPAGLPVEPLPPEPPEPPEPPVCQLVLDAYQPSVWNYYPVIFQNNCYNYAMNKQTNTFAQPGRKGGHMAAAMNCSEVGAAASRDGCKTACSGPSRRVALVIWPGWDYHWYRKHAGGFWAHKPGRTAARNTDSLNRVIDGTALTPANCARGPYTVFCGYRWAPKNIVIS